MHVGSFGIELKGCKHNLFRLGKERKLSPSGISDPTLCALTDPGLRATYAVDTPQTLFPISHSDLPYLPQSASKWLLTSFDRPFNWVHTPAVPPVVPTISQETFSMTRLLLPALLLVFLLGGCATTPVPISAAKQAAADRVLAFQTVTDNKTGTLTVIRDEGFIGSACYYAVHINGVLAARLDVAEFARFYVEPGEILLRAGRDPQGGGLCGVALDNWTQRETFLKPGEQKAFRLSIDSNGKLDIQRSDFK